MRLHQHVHGGNDGFAGRRSRFYDLLATRFFRRAYRRLARDLAPLAPEGAAVLDVGTGPGVLLVELARLRPDLRITGVDLSPDMVAAAQRKLADWGGRVEAVTGDVAALPFPDGSFDLIVSSLSLHHWPRPAEARPELARVLRPGGRICVYDVPAAPFDELTAGGEVLQRSRIRSGIPFLPALTRMVFTPAR